MRGRLLWRTLPLALWMFLSGCGGTWVDDERNFNRVFGFSKPVDVKVIHSFYWKSPHWSVEYIYFIVLQAPAKFGDGLTSSGVMTKVESGRALLKSCGDKRPQWFLPKSITDYEAWLPKGTAEYRVYRDRADGTLFLCDQRL